MHEKFLGAEPPRQFKVDKHNSNFVKTIAHSKLIDTSLFDLTVFGRNGQPCWFGVNRGMS